MHARSHGLATWSAKDPQRPVPGSPYRGLDAFAESDEDVFFGRDAAITDVMGLLSAVERAQRGRAGPWHPRRLRRLRRLWRGQVLALARGDTAATAPSRHRGGPEVRSWPCLLFTPGKSPLAELAAQVAASGQSWLCAPGETFLPPTLHVRP